MGGRTSGAPEDPRSAFAAALTALRRNVAGLSDEALARRASSAPLPSGRHAGVNARRLGEWLAGRSVPRDFDAVVAVVRAVEAASGGAVPPLSSWHRLWRAAVDDRGPARTGEPEAARVIVGRPPSDASAFRDRAALADAIDAALADAELRQVLLTGPGGVGKSQLAAAAFHRAGARFEVLLWVPASSRESILATYARAWRALSQDAGGVRPDGPGPDDLTQADLFVAWLRAAGRPWLVVLDDVDEPAELAGLWPAGDRGRCLVTTRRRDAAVIRAGTRVIEVGMFTPEEAGDYLCERLSGGAADQELAGLADELGRYPLALSQAAAFLIDTGITVAAYRGLLADRREPLAELFPRSSPADEHGETVAGTVRLALERAAQLGPPAAVTATMQLLAVLSADGVPQAVLATPAARAWAGVRSEHGALLALRALHRLNLLTHDPARGWLEVHALVQRAARETVPEPRWPALLRAAASALDEAWAAPDSDAGALFRSTATLRGHADGELVTADGLHPLLRRPAAHLLEAGAAAAARETARDLLGQARPRLGDEHRDVLFLSTELACAEGELGEAAAADRALAETRRSAERALGRADPDTLRVRLHAARFRMESGAPEAALRDLVDLLADAGPDADADTMLSARRYAALCRGLSGDPAGARAGYDALVEELRGRRGAGHRDTLTALSDLGRWIGETGDPAGAVATYREAAEGLEPILGPLHHDTLVARHNLAYWRGLAGQPELAVEEFAVAARDAERALGADHPTTLTYRVNLAYWRGLAGAPGRGLAELEELQPAVERVLGREHPRALRARQQRAQVRYAAGDRAGAAAELRDLLAEMTRIQGPDHVRTREAAGLLAAWDEE